MDRTVTFQLSEVAAERIQNIVYYPTSRPVDAEIEVDLSTPRVVDLYCNIPPTKSDELNNDIASEVAAEYRRNCNTFARAFVVYLRGSRYPVVL